MEIELEVRESMIPAAGMGLFASCDIPKNAVVCEYTGRIYSTKETLNLKDRSYLMRLGAGVYVDAISEDSTVARFINDCRHPLLYNVRFKKLPLLRKAQIISNRAIKKGEEIFASYGQMYWLGMDYKPNRISPKKTFLLLQYLGIEKEITSNK